MLGEHSQIWGGLIGSLGLQEGGEGADFYASFYNDHVSDTLTIFWQTLSSGR